jgi:sulfite dehydrogenase (cytochrome) subunit B
MIWPAKFLSRASLLVLAAASLARVSDKTIQLPGDNPAGELKTGEGVGVVRSNCVACHSTDYIVRQPGQDAQHWEAEVRKMIAVFGAPVSESDVQVIVKYLASAYGPLPKQDGIKQKPADARRSEGGRQPPSERIQR